uniref:Uncharacterized protein n=1 Tax=Rhizophora mucronata TaxID=61149 RepID=A0A2P2R3C1_RHIMU
MNLVIESLVLVDVR